MAIVLSELHGELLRADDLAGAVVAWSERALQTLRAVREVTEAKHVVDVMTVVETVCRVRDVHIDAAIAASTMRVLAERRLGQLLAEQPKARGTGKPGVRATVPNGDSRTLDEQGISRNESSRFQRLGSLDDEAFEDALGAVAEDVRDRGIGNVTTTAVIRHVAPDRERNDNDRWIDGDRLVSAAKRLVQLADPAIAAMRFGKYPGELPLVREAAIKELRSARAACVAALVELEGRRKS